MHLNVWNKYHAFLNKQYKLESKIEHHQFFYKTIFTEQKLNEQLIETAAETIRLGWFTSITLIA